MPLYEYECLSKRNPHRWEKYYNVSEIKEGRDKAEYNDCPVCDNKSRKIISIAVSRMGKKSKWTGIDDEPDKLTLGKIAADGKIPAEHKRAQRENVKKMKVFLKQDKEYKERRRRFGFNSID